MPMSPDKHCACPGCESGTHLDGTGHCMSAFEIEPSMWHTIEDPKRPDQRVVLCRECVHQAHV